MKQLVAVAISVALVGCSFVFVHGPDTDPTPVPVYPECTGNKTWPIIDTVLAGLYIAGGFGALNKKDEPMPGPGSAGADNDLSPQAAAAVSFSAAAIAGAAAFVGFRRVAACRDARDGFRAKYPQGVPYYQPYPGQYPPGYAPQPPGYPPGYEGGQCWQGNICVQGLVCGSGLCVRPPQSGPLAPPVQPQPQAPASGATP